MTLLQEKIPPPPPPRPRKLGQHLSDRGVLPSPELVAGRIATVRTSSWQSDEPGHVRKVVSGSLADADSDFICALENLLAFKRPSLPDLSDPALSSPSSPRPSFLPGSPKLGRFVPGKKSTKTFPGHCPSPPKPKSPKLPRREIVTKISTPPIEIRNRSPKKSNHDRLESPLSPRGESAGRSPPTGKSLTRAKSIILGFSASKIKTTKTNQVFVGEALEKGMLLQVAMFHLKQQFPDFPVSQIRTLLRREKSLTGVHDFLIDHGWEEKPFVPSTAGDFPPYYYGIWSYDCWLAFERCSVGSYISCIKSDKYCLVYKSATGDVLTETIPEETPEVNRNLIKKYSLTTPIPRPPKRLVCDVCKNETPCKVLTSDHPCIPVAYPLSCDTQSWKDFLLSC